MQWNSFLGKKVSLKVQKDNLICRKLELTGVKDLMEIKIIKFGFQYNFCSLIKIEILRVYLHCRILTINYTKKSFKTNKN